MVDGSAPRAMRIPISVWRARTACATTTLPSIFTALQEQLGLRLDAARAPVDVLVIDRIERETPD
jgi:uncharacterized protein (TIGR03435 family)